jgi:hypothetical protein
MSLVQGNTYWAGVGIQSNVNMMYCWGIAATTTDAVRLGVPAFPYPNALQDRIFTSATSFLSSFALSAASKLINELTYGTASSRMMIIPGMFLL